MLTKTELEPSTCTVLMSYGSPSVPHPPNAIRAGGFLLVQTMALRCFQVTHLLLTYVVEVSENSLSQRSYYVAARFDYAAIVVSSGIVTGEEGVGDGLSLLIAERAKWIPLHSSTS